MGGFENKRKGSTGVKYGCVRGVSKIRRGGARRKEAEGARRGRESTKKKADEAKTLFLARQEVPGGNIYSVRLEYLTVMGPMGATMRVV